MITINTLLQRLSSLDVDMVASQSVDQEKEEMLSLNLEQLMEGKNKDGDDLSPGYLEDPYFKSRESAQRYSDWKDKITPNPKRTKGVPNLYIDGTFHKSIKVRVNGDSIDFDASASDAPAIERKFKKIYGLNADKRKSFIKVLLPVLMKKVKSIIKL